MVPPVHGRIRRGPAVTLNPRLAMATLAARAQHTNQVAEAVTRRARTPPRRRGLPAAGHQPASFTTQVRLSLQLLRPLTGLPLSDAGLEVRIGSTFLVRLAVTDGRMP
jgi:hypothetical protein